MLIRGIESGCFLVKKLLLVFLITCHVIHAQNTRITIVTPPPMEGRSMPIKSAFGSESPSELLAAAVAAAVGPPVLVVVEVLEVVEVDVGEK